MAKKKYKIDDEGLEDLLNSILLGCEEDIKETEENIGFYKQEILNNKNSKDMYGHLLHEALRLKGDARDRAIKAINLVKDRVKAKEFIKSNKTNDTMPTPDQIQAALDEGEDTK